MSRRAYLVVASCLAIAAAGAVVFAARTKPTSLGGATATGSGRQAPGLDAKGWINTAPLTKADLRGKVVLYDFWTYSCVNCVRTIPSLRSWYDQYRKDGLVVVGVHSPEFDFEKNHQNVARAVTKLGVDYPVALDDDMTIWNDFGNQYWPADYLYDRNGRQASVHFGEGGYQKTEDEIRRLLGIPSTAPRAVVKGQEGGSPGSGDQTQETYNGSERGSDGFASPEALTNGERRYSAPAMLQPGEHALSGQWIVSGQYVEAAAPGASLVLSYVAGQVNLVMSTASGQPVDVQVQVDTQVPTTVHVTAADLYTLSADHTTGAHVLRLTAAAAGLRAFAFTFGG